MNQQITNAILYRQMIRESAEYIQIQMQNSQNSQNQKEVLSAENCARAAVVPPVFYDEIQEQEKRMKRVQETLTHTHKCKKCNSICIVYEKQERAADEGGTIYYQCTNSDCNHVYKIV